MSRTAEVRRATPSATVVVRLALDGRGRASARTGVAAFDHLLEIFAQSGRFDLDVAADGHAPAHRVVVAAGAALGEAFARALGEGAGQGEGDANGTRGREGIRGVGEATIPVAGALVRAVCDLRGQEVLAYHAAPPAWQLVDDYDVGLTSELWQAFVVAARATLHLDLLRGEDGRHITDAVYAAAGRAFAQAAERDTRIAESGAR